MITDSGYFDEKPSQIVIDEAGKSYMLETARWARFLAIIGMVVMGFAMLGAIGMMMAAPMLSKELGQPMGGFGPGISVFYILLVCIFFYPMYTLLRFANLLKHAVNNTNQQQFDDAFRFLKNTFRFWGIYIIIILFIYGIFMLFATTVAITSAI